MPSPQLIPLGLLVVVIGIILIILGSLGGKSDVKVGVGGFIGPIPFGFGNDKTMVYIAIAITLVFFLSFLLIRALRQN